MTPEHETRERILEAAFELFHSRGYDQVSLNDITLKANVSKGGLFHYFDSKYSLARDSLMWWASKKMEPDMIRMIHEDMEPRELLTAFVDFMLDIFVESSGFTKFFWGVFDESMRREEDHSIWLEFLDGYVSMVSSQYEAMGVINPRERALLFLASMDGMALYSEVLKNTGSELDMGAMKSAIIDSFVNIGKGE
jgi:AcrR family transcriptional regulator